MAIGISLMFGIFLPLNFNSPYKATSIIDFWRRWHMTLSQFLRDYLYIPLGGNRHGPVLRYVNLDDHHAARRPLARRGLDVCGLGRAARRLSLHQSRLEQLRARRFRRALRRLADIAGLILTFLAVVVAWVFFRADRHVDRALRAVEDGRSRQCRLRPRRNRLRAVRRRLCRARRGSRRTRRRSWATTTRTGRSAKISGAWRMRPLFLYATAAVLAFGILGIQQHSEFIYFRF